MFKNKIPLLRGKDKSRPVTGKIADIFASIQGEGIYLGERQVFVRFAGCNLSCCYCDTDFSKFREYEVEELIARIKYFGRGFHSVSFTGGEPLMQKDFLKEALRLLKECGYKTYLETNGTLPEALKEVMGCLDIIAMDIKLPSATGAKNGFWKEHREFLGAASKADLFIKVVITGNTNNNDILVMLDLLKDMRYCGVLVLQPDGSGSSPELKEKLNLLRNMCKDYSMPVCVIPQMQKIMGLK